VTEIDRVYRRAEEAELDGFLELMRAEAGEYLGPSVRLLGISWDEFSRLFRSRGEIHCLESDGHNAGFCWIELRERTLHIHALVLRPADRGHGLAGRLLRELAEAYRERADRFELGVHESNRRARALYERAGFREVRRLPGIGFHILQRALDRTPAADPDPPE
jgi:ribosomal protein S18 acetylase RimI-like enzyme